MEEASLDLFDEDLTQRRARRAGDAHPLWEISAEALRERMEDRLPPVRKRIEVGRRSILPDTQLTQQVGEAREIDLLLSSLFIQSINRLPDFFKQVYEALAPEGLFLASFYGDDTLGALRQSLMTAEEEIYGGISPRVAPMLGMQDAGKLLQRAGFVAPVVDKERIVLVYPDLWALLRDLRAMGEGNSLLKRSRRPVSRRFFERADSLYKTLSPGPNGGISAQFDLLFVHGWKS